MRRLLPRSPAIALLLAGIAASCTPAPPKPAPRPAIVRPVPPPPAAPAPIGPDWRDWPLTPGTWSYRQDERGSLALFGIAGGDAALTLRCDRGARAIYLSRAGSAAAPLTLRTTSLTRAVAVRPTGGTPPYVAAALAPGDPLLDAMGFSRGRFVVEQPGAPTLVVPRLGRGGAGDRGLPLATPSTHRIFAKSRLALRRRMTHIRSVQRWALGYQQAKGGDPMSHGSAVSSVRFVRGMRF